MVLSYMVSDVRSPSFVGADDGYIVEIALLSSFIDHRATACPKLLIQNKVLHRLLERRRPQTIIYYSNIYSASAFTMDICSGRIQDILNNTIIKYTIKKHKLYIVAC